MLCFPSAVTCMWNDLPPFSSSRNSVTTTTMTTTTTTTSSSCISSSKCNSSGSNCNFLSTSRSSDIQNEVSEVITLWKVSTLVVKVIIL